MILFIAPNPESAKNKEGFLQRVAAIDAVFSDEDKVYYDDLTSLEAKAKALLEAKVIYVHSIYNANKILKCYEYFADKIITDLHGVVPEEEVYADNLEMARVMGVTEKSVFEHGRYFVAVSRAMIDHFTKKYELSTATSWIVLPIYHTDLPSTSHDKDNKTPDLTTVIYAGGGQSWQNTGLMVDAINKTSDNYKFILLTHDPDSFSGLDEKALQRTTIKSVSSQEVAEYYKKASLGFILRKDTLVNNVACPTKLVEYLCYGVVPIVLSDNIGDFKALGYRYFKLDEFLAGRIPDEKIIAAVAENRRVYHDFIDLASAGKKTLIEVWHTINGRISDGSAIHLCPELVAANLAAQEERNQILRYEYQMEVYKKKVEEYAELAEHYRKQLDQNSNRAESYASRTLKKIRNRIRSHS